MAEEDDTENHHSSTDKADATAARIFISYASHDTQSAQKVCSSLEAAGLRCWMAPRDVKAGAQYADAIVRAINEAGTMILVLSASAVAFSAVRSGAFPMLRYSFRAAGGAGMRLFQCSGPYTDIVKRFTILGRGRCAQFVLRAVRDGRCRSIHIIREILAAATKGSLHAEGDR